MKPKDWIILRNPITKEDHLIPENDVFQHSLSPECACNPDRDTAKRAIVSHYAYDGRELIEAAENGDDIP